MSRTLPSAQAPAGEWRGVGLGERGVSWNERDAILYALAVGAGATDLDLVFEERLRVLPTFALTLAQWAPDLLGSAGAFEVGRALHGGQRLRSYGELPAAGELRMSARVGEVWDKGSAAVFDVVVESDLFEATWSLFAPGRGGFGGDRGPGRAPAPATDSAWRTRWPTAANQAALYRLLGDRHRIHIDPDAARAIGRPRPILHGLATLATATLAAADTIGAHPAGLTAVAGRFADVVLPGDELTVEGWDDGRFLVRTERGTVMDEGRFSFE
ncbi:MaoC/PaaZ C-terminal domain-containing protein [Streptomyces mirabilis]|uniref:MaoC/PaaZ C-terminal domain-containing protein n=1 Tax=Streptomyces mirabilis TaxID=68239 RepID=UPI00339FC476